jgi:hypothetical protein
MFQAAGDAGFLDEALTASAVAAGGEEHFHRDVSAKRFIDGFVDDAHTATAEFTDDAILADARRFGGPFALAAVRTRSSAVQRLPARRTGTRIHGSIPQQFPNRRRDRSIGARLSRRRERPPPGTMPDGAGRQGGRTPRSLRSDDAKASY